MATLCKTQVDISQGKFYLWRKLYEDSSFSCQVMNLIDRSLPANTIGFGQEATKIIKLLQRNPFVLYPNWWYIRWPCNAQFWTKSSILPFFERNARPAAFSSTEMASDFRVARQQTLPTLQDRGVSFLVCTVFSNHGLDSSIPIGKGNQIPCGE